MAPTRPAGLDTPEAFRAWWWSLSAKQRLAYSRAQTGMTAPERVKQQRREARAAARGAAQ